jgi:excisionase family DNA binding protein
MKEKTESQAPRYLRFDEAAQYLNIPVRTLKDWRLKRQGPPARKFGKSVRFEIGDLDAWADSQREAAR